MGEMRATWTQAPFPAPSEATAVRRASVDADAGPRPFSTHRFSYARIGAQLGVAAALRHARGARSEAREALVLERELLILQRQR